MPNPTPAELQRAIQAAMAGLATVARERIAQRRQLTDDLRLPDDNKRELLKRHDSAARAERQQQRARIDQLLEQYQRAAILAAPPSARPPSAAENAWLSAQAALAPHWTPQVLTARIAQATAAQDRGMLDLLVPFAESRIAYRPEFSVSAAPALARAVHAAKPVLQSAEERQSDANAQWLERARADARTLDNIFSDAPDRAAARLETHLSVNAFASTIPSAVPGPYTQEWSDAQQAARVSRVSAGEHPTGTGEPFQQQPDEPPSRPIVDPATNPRGTP